LCCYKRAFAGSSSALEGRVCNNVLYKWLQLLYFYLLYVNSHAGILKGDIKCMSNQLDVLLRPTLPSSAAKDDGKHARGSSTVDSLSLYGTGEEQQASIIASCDSLVKLLRSAVSSSTDLPLSITAVHGVSAAFRYSEVTVLHCCM